MTYLTVRDVADRFQCSARTVERMIERGELQAFRLGPKLIRIPPTAIEAFEARVCPTDSTAPSSTANDPASGTSAGPMADARVVALRARLTR